MNARRGFRASPYTKFFNIKIFPNFFRIAGAFPINASLQVYIIIMPSQHSEASLFVILAAEN